MIFRSYDINLREDFGIGIHLSFEPGQRVAFRFHLINCSRAIQNRKIGLTLTDSKLI